MVCLEYFPSSTHGGNPDCHNCLYRGYGGGIMTCRNVNVRNYLRRNLKVIK